MKTRLNSNAVNSNLSPIGLNSNNTNLKKLEKYLSNDVCKKFNISEFKTILDSEDSKYVFVFKINNKSPEEISELSLKIRQESYYYAKEHDLLDDYNNAVFLLRR